MVWGLGGGGGGYANIHTIAFWLLLANFKFCTIGSSMSVDHEGTVQYTQRGSTERKQHFACDYWTFSVHFTVWKREKLFFRVY